MTDEQLEEQIDSMIRRHQLETAQWRLPHISEIVSNEDEIEDLVISVQPHRSNGRMLAQQELFLMPKNLDKSFIENLYAYQDYDPKKHFYRILMPHAIQGEVQRDLHFMNITKLTLFPSLESLAASMTEVLEELARSSQPNE